MTTRPPIIVETGITSADELIALARDLGLTVDIKRTINKPLMSNDGRRQLIPGSTSYVITIRIPVPEVYSRTALGMEERNSTIMVTFNRYNESRSRGKYMLGESYGLYTESKKLGSPKAAMSAIRGYGASLKLLQRRAEGESRASERN